jgi:hypothetical protein
MGEADTRACFLAHRVEGGEGVLLEEQRAKRRIRFRLGSIRLGKMQLGAPLKRVSSLRQVYSAQKRGPMIFLRKKLQGFSVS